MRDDDRGPDSRRRSNGHRPSGMNARPTHLRAVEEPVDLVAVQADDELISALAAGMTVSAPGYGGYDADDHVAAILAAWREEVDAEPIPELVDVDTAIATIRAAGRPRSRSRHLAPIAAAAAAGVLLVGGVTVGSASARPDSLLWPVSKVLYSERADSIEAAARVTARIGKAKLALTSGQSIVAAQELREAQADLGAIRPEEGQAQLSEVQDFLVAKAEETPPGKSTDPGQPLETDRQRRVPPGAAVGEDPATTPAEPGPTTGSTGQQTGGTQPGGDPGTMSDPSMSASTTPTPSVTPSGTVTPSPTATPEGGPASGTPTSGQSMGSSSPNTTEGAARTS